MAQGASMLVHISKSARYLAVASCFSGIGGCASDGGAGELAVVGLVVGAASMDSGTLLTAAAVGTGLMFAASMSGGDDVKTDTPPTALSPAVASPATTTIALAAPTPNPTKPVQGSSLEQFLARETVAKYQGRSCDYLQLSLSDADSLIASTGPIAPQVGLAQKSAVTQSLKDRNCPSLSPLAGRIGASIDTIDPVKAPQLKLPTAGVWVNSVLPGSNAEKAGLSRGDVVVAVNDNPIKDTADFRLAIGQSAIGSTARLKVWHAQKFYDAPVLIGQ